MWITEEPKLYLLANESLVFELWQCVASDTPGTHLVAVSEVRDEDCLLTNGLMPPEQLVSLAKAKLAEGISCRVVFLLGDGSFETSVVAEKAFQKASLPMIRETYALTGPEGVSRRLDCIKSSDLEDIGRKISKQRGYRLTLEPIFVLDESLTINGNPSPVWA